MRTIIAGSREIWSYDLLERAIDEIDWPITQVVCGMARGADSVGWAWAFINDIPIAEFYADWDSYAMRSKNPAGIIRNQQMAKNADALIALWDGKSRGTDHMIKEATKRNLKVAIVNI